MYVQLPTGPNTTSAPVKAPRPQSAIMRMACSGIPSDSESPINMCILIKIVILGFTLEVGYVAAQSGDTLPIPEKFIGRNAGVREFCETETFKAKCAEDEVIMMTTAKSGRMRLGRCVHKDLGFIGCAADVLPLADQKCSGKRECDIRIPDSDFNSNNLCLEELNTYFEASYSCLKVFTVENASQCEQPVTIKENFGYIASSLTSELGCGSQSAPFIIQALPGQRVNITLLDFNSQFHQTSNIQPDHLQIYEACRKYATLEESGSGIVTICSGHDRMRPLYVSSNHSVTIKIHVDEKTGLAPAFVIQYQVIGCPDIATTSGLVVKRLSSETTVVGCDTTADKWTLHCSGNNWVGAYGNCTFDTRPAVSETDSHVSGMEFGASIAIIVCLAFLVGLVVFIFGIILFRRCKYGARHRNRHVVLAHETEAQEMELNEDVGTIKPPPPKTEIETVTLPSNKTRYKILKTDPKNDYAHIWESSTAKAPARSPQGEQGGMGKGGGDFRTTPRCHSRCPHYHGHKFSHDETCLKQPTCDLLAGTLKPVKMATQTLNRKEMNVKNPKFPCEGCSRYYVLDKKPQISDAEFNRHAHHSHGDVKQSMSTFKGSPKL